MKAGRPMHHVKAKWIRVESEDRTKFEIFSLDSKGRLITNSNGVLIPCYSGLNEEDNKNVEIPFGVKMQDVGNVKAQMLSVENNFDFTDVIWLLNPKPQKQLI